MAKAKKTASGKWRIQVYDYTDANGKVHLKSITDDTKAGAEYRAAAFTQQKAFRTAKIDREWTVAEAIDKYIELKELLSPTTLNAYKKIKEYAFQDIMQMKVSKIDDLVMQSAINREAKRTTQREGKPLSPKTVRNEYGLLAAALREVCKREYHVSLPTYQKHTKIYPEPEEVVAAIRGTDIELPCLLALWLSFSMSEIRGLMCSDIHDGRITINRVMVDTASGAVTKGNAKVETRLRTHIIPEYIMRLINNTTTYKNFVEIGEDGPLITASRDRIYGRWQTICKQNALPPISFQDLRHLSASVMSWVNIPEKYAMERGGWKTPHVMKSVYMHTLSEERKEADRMVNNYFESILKS